MRQQHPIITVLSLLFLLLLLIGAIASAYDCVMIGGALVRAAAGNYVCVQPMRTAK